MKYVLPAAFEILADDPIYKEEMIQNATNQMS